MNINRLILRTLRWSGVAVASVILALPVSAQPSYPELKRGLEYGDVVKLWGEPKEKQEFEVKRDDLWHYAGAKVVFHEGRVSAWKIGDTLYNGSEQPAIDPSQVKKPRKKEDVGVEEILSEIMKEPSSPDEPTSPSGGSVPPPPPPPGVNPQNNAVGEVPPMEAR